MVTFIAISKGREHKILIDSNDYLTVSKHNWSVYKKGITHYAVTFIKRKRLALHNLLMSPAKGMVVDHINGNALDNRRGNLRICTLSQNQHNRRKHKKKTSRYKGVHWCNTLNRWLAKIAKEGKTYHIGCFKNEDEAAKAYDRAALELHGEFACLNIKLDKEGQSNVNRQ